MIRDLGQVLRATLKQQLVSNEVHSTFMAEAVYMINSRPLTCNSNDHSDDIPITPNHLLHLRPFPTLPPGTFEKSYLYAKCAGRQAQYLAQVSWRRWTSQYFPALLELQKWNVKRRNISVGDIVLFADDNYSRGNWPLARVVETYAGPDGLVRVAKVKTTSTVATYSKKKRKRELSTSTVFLVRPVTKLCLLELDCD